MATHHRGIGCPLDRDIDLNKENTENTETEIENTHDFDATVAPNEPEETGHPYKIGNSYKGLRWLMSMSVGWGSTTNR